jgi:Recombinase
VQDAAPLAEEQAAVARILELRRAGEPYRAIVATLDAEGLKPQRAEHWPAMTVRNVVTRELTNEATV